MTGVTRDIQSVSGLNVEQARALILDTDQPVVFRGLVSDWPLVQKGRESIAVADAYLRQHYEGAPVTACFSDRDIEGRIFYEDDCTRVNFRQVRTTLDQVLDQILASSDKPSAPLVYLGSAALSYYLPGMKESHSLSFDNTNMTVRIWIGNRTRVASHYDALEGIACVCAGRRRFTLFPPEQLENLYVGPIDITPAGQSISLVDLNDPDLERYPRFATALEHAQALELEPGDAVYIPAMWWHNVEALEDYNILINHWWREGPAFMGAPQDALLHAIMNIRPLRAVERAAWRAHFEHYVFDADPASFAHIPEEGRGVLGDLDEQTVAQMRALLRKNLNR